MIYLVVHTNMKGCKYLIEQNYKTRIVIHRLGIPLSVTISCTIYSCCKYDVTESGIYDLLAKVTTGAK